MSELEECRRESTDIGPDFCASCSAYLEEWVVWEGHRELVKTVKWLREQLQKAQDEGFSI